MYRTLNIKEKLSAKATRADNYCVGRVIAGGNPRSLARRGRLSRLLQFKHNGGYISFSTSPYQILYLLIDKNK